MIKKLRNTLLISIALALAAVSLAPLPSTVSAQTTRNEVCEGVARTGGSCGSGETEVNNVIAAVINILSVAVGVVSVIMIIIGGFKYVTSGGDSGSVQSAKNTILYAIVGLVVALLARAIVTFVLDRAAP